MLYTCKHVFPKVGFSEYKNGLYYHILFSYLPSYICSICGIISTSGIKLKF